MGHPEHTKEELSATLRKMYPEIGAHGLDLSADFNHEKDAWLVHLKKGEHELSTHLERQDANACLEGVQCVYLGVQIGQFIKNFEGDEA